MTELAPQRGRGRPRITLSDEQLRDLLEAAQNDAPWKELVDRFGLSRASLWRLVGAKRILKQNS